MAAKLKTIYDTQDDIPEQFRELYIERNGKFEITGIEGVKTQADIDRQTAALEKERKDHKAVREKLAKWGDLDPDAIPVQLEELNEAKQKIASLSAEGKLEGQALTDRLEAAAEAARGPLQREIKSTQARLAAKEKEAADKDAAINALKNEQKMERIRVSLRDAAIAAKVIPEALDDAVMVGERMFDYTDDGKLLTKADAPVTAGLDPKTWAVAMKETRPHWWPPSLGGGSGGSKGSGGLNSKDNPWTRENWNITEQGRKVVELGAPKAAEMAARVGSKLGATHPPAAKTA